MKKLNNIGILTFWGVPNHGCFLQAYALQRVINNMYPNTDVKHIAYLNKQHYAHYYGGVKLIFLNILSYIKKIQNKKKLQEYLGYYRVIPHTHNEDIRVFPKEKFDVIVIGSDIVWDLSSSLVAGDEYLFGIGTQTNKLLSYAPSTGRMPLDINVPDYAVSGLKNFDYISVRDEKTQKFVEKYGGSSPLIVLDPTLLYDFSKDDKVVLPKERSPYVVVYGNDFDDAIVDCVREDARAKGLSIINLDFIGKEYDWCDKTIGRSQLHPLEWVGYFKNAEYVVTSTFHGLVFGIIFNKKILFHSTPFILDKATMLIKELGMTEYLLDASDKAELIQREWDYDAINHSLQIMRDNSMDYLRKSIGSSDE